MALSHRLELRQSQSLVMTPQLMQAIKLLQLSNLDLAAYVDAELERNPLLELEEAAEGEARDADVGREQVPGDERFELAEATDAGQPADGAADKLDADMANVFPDDHEKPAEEVLPKLPTESWASPGSRQPVGAGSYNLEAFVADEKSLVDHMSEQFALAEADPAMRLIGHAVINAIDETGYFRDDADALAKRLGTDRSKVDNALATIQTLEPTGIGARDLAECLAIQLRERDRFDPAMEQLVGHLDLVARRDLARLRSLCRVDQEDLTDMLGELRSLNPKPGNAFGGGPVQIIVPDVTVRPGPDGNWLVELNQETLPKLLVDQAYYAIVTGGNRSDADRAYLSDCMATANWLVKSLDQRARTILKVASEIVRQQDAFLVNGVQHLRPLNLKTVADAIGMHESTVSRGTSNKYMATPRGIFELKYFFTAAIPSSGDGEAHSAESVRHRIRGLIAGEEPDSVLSDDAIVGLLSQAGVDIARRTVAKYREAMRIPSSVQRRREKQAAS